MNRTALRAEAIQAPGSGSLAGSRFGHESDVCAWDSGIAGPRQIAAAIADALTAAGRNPQVIGGAHTASELDAKRAIAQAAQLAAGL